MVNKLGNGLFVLVMWQKLILESMSNLPWRLTHSLFASFCLFYRIQAKRFPGFGVASGRINSPLFRFGRFQSFEGPPTGPIRLWRYRVNNSWPWIKTNYTHARERFAALPVRPDLAKFRHFGKKLNCLSIFWEFILNLVLFRPIFNAIGQFFIVVSDRKLTK